MRLNLSQHDVRVFGQRQVCGYQEESVGIDVEASPSHLEILWLAGDNCHAGPFIEICPGTC